MPVIAPIRSEMKTNKKNGRSFSSIELTGFKSIEVPAEIKIIANPRVMNLSERCLAKIDPPIFVIKPSAQIIKASLINTFFFLNFGIAPAKAALKTIAKAATVANLGLKSNK